MKNIKAYSMLLILVNTFAWAQVGINTDTPNPGTTLDVNGKMNMEQRIYLSDGTDLADAGDPGTDKQVIVSGGSAENPQWEAKRLPAGYGLSYTMTYMNTFYDEVGADLTGLGTDLYTLNEPLTNNWTVIPGLNNEFTLYKNDSKVNLIFQTLPQINRTDANSGSASFACGLFVNSQSSPTVFKLKAARVDAVRGVAGSNKIFNMNITLDGSSDPELNGSPAGNKYQLRVACRGRTISSGTTFAIGKALNPNSLNAQMARSSLNIFVLEKW